jgi:hypothetical protein
LLVVVFHHDETTTAISQPAETVGRWVGRTPSAADTKITVNVSAKLLQASADRNAIVRENSEDILIKKDVNLFFRTFRYVCIVLSSDHGT